MRRRRKRAGLSKNVAAIFLAVSLLGLPNNSVVLQAEGSEDSELNRYNVVFVLDASKSMDYTDPEDLRYEAIKKFTSYLAETGNYLGGVVFAQDVAISKDPSFISNQKEKDAVTDLLESKESLPFTNIGDGLLKATEMLESSGSKDLPSAIVFLSDGNTEMPSQETQKSSLDNKAEAIEEARSKGYKIHSVCLNVDNTADSTEMKQISDATGGAFVEITSAEGFKEAMDGFYSEIFGTIPKNIKDTIDESGKLETEFVVPGFGVEEINIVVSGKKSSLELIGPDGKKENVTVVESDTFSSIKISNVQGGTWKLITYGKKGEDIEIDIVYNSNLKINLDMEPSILISGTKDETVFSAELMVAEIPAIDSSELNGYTAKLLMENVYDKSIQEFDMKPEDGKFILSGKFQEGLYNVKAEVSGYNLIKTSNILESVQIVEGNGPDAKSKNQAPVPVKEEITETVYIWPFKGGSMTLDLNELAEDPDGDSLHYMIESSSFIEGNDYNLDGNILKMENFSLSKGSYDIAAMDTFGEKAHVKVNVRAVNVGIMAAIGFAAAGLIGLVILGILAYILSTKPFNGPVTVYSSGPNGFKGKLIRAKRGKIKLSSYGLDPTPLNYQKSYIQATGKGYVVLHTNIPVIVNGKETKKADVYSGSKTYVTFKNSPVRLEISYDQIRRR